MGDYQWVGPGTDVADGNNWRDEIHGTTGTAPGPDDDAIIFTAGSLTGDMDVNSLSIESQGAATLQFGGGGLETDIEVEGAAVSILGLVTFNDASLEPDGLAVGTGSTLQFTNGDLQDAYFGSNDITIGGAQMGTAALIVDRSYFGAGLGSGTLTIGGTEGGTGTLTVENGSNYHSSATLTVIGADSNSPGQVTISGSTTEADFDGLVEIGGNGTGNFTLSGGAYASLGLDSSVVLGGQGAAGTLTSTGAGSLLTVAGDMQVGSYDGSSAGTAVITHGATLAVAADILNPQGTLTVSGAGSVLSAREYEALGTASGLDITTGATASFVDTSILEGSVTLQGGTLNTRLLLENLTTIKGTGVVNSGTLYNYATISASGGTLQINGPEYGSGSNLIAKASTLELDGSVAHSQKIGFNAGATALDLKDAAGMQGLIRNFTAGEKIDLLGDAATKASFANDILTITNGTTAVATLRFAGSYVGADFKLASDGRGGTLVTYSATSSHPIAPHEPGIFSMPHIA